MDYHRSTQARGWMFDKDSLLACKQQAVRAGADEDVGAEASPSSSTSTEGVRKFASGFHQNYQTIKTSDTPLKCTETSEISVGDQEILVQFHAHQIQTLIGPGAIVRDLRTSETVLSTAVTFFRRFYLSNSIVQVHPRNIAVACAFLAAKVEEERVQIELLSHATTVIRDKVHNGSDCRQELLAVSVLEIEEAERKLMLGLDYMFRCYHTSSALQNLIPDFCAFLCGRDEVEYSIRQEDRLVRKGLEVARRALLFSDVPFLYTPCHTAFAITTMVSRSITEEGKMGNDIQAFLVKAFPHKTRGQMLSFTRTVHEIVDYLMNCPRMDLRPAHGERAMELTTTRAEEIRRVLGIAAKFRRACPPTERQLKRLRYEPDFTPPQLQARKYAKVTPIGRRVSFRASHSEKRETREM